MHNDAYMIKQLRGGGRVDQMETKNMVKWTKSMVRFRKSLHEIVLNPKPKFGLLHGGLVALCLMILCHMFRLHDNVIHMMLYALQNVGLIWSLFLI